MKRTGIYYLLFTRPSHFDQMKYKEEFLEEEMRQTIKPGFDYNSVLYCVYSKNLKLHINITIFELKKYGKINYA